MICPNCEKEIEANIAQCPHCGCHFSVEVVPKPAPIPMPVIEERSEEKLQVKEVQPKIQEAITMQTCTKCGKQVATHARFCKWCGYSLSQAQEMPPIVLNNQPAKDENAEENMQVNNVCESCGRTIKSSAMFCKWCGSPCNDKKHDEK